MVSAPVCDAQYGKCLETYSNIQRILLFLLPGSAGRRPSFDNILSILTKAHNFYQIWQKGGPSPCLLHAHLNHSGRRYTPKRREVFEATVQVFLSAATFLHKVAVKRPCYLYLAHPFKTVFIDPGATETTLVSFTKKSLARTKLSPR